MRKDVKPTKIAIVLYKLLFGQAEAVPEPIFLGGIFLTTIFFTKKVNLKLFDQIKLNF